MAKSLIQLHLVCDHDLQSCLAPLYKKFNWVSYQKEKQTVQICMYRFVDKLICPATSNIESSLIGLSWPQDQCKNFAIKQYWTYNCHDTNKSKEVFSNTKLCNKKVLLHKYSPSSSSSNKCCSYKKLFQQNFITWQYSSHLAAIPWANQLNYSSPSIIRILDYPNSSEATFYYEYYYNSQDSGSLVAFVAALTSCFLLLFSVEECLSVQ